MVKWKPYKVRPKLLLGSSGPINILVLANMLYTAFAMCMCLDQNGSRARCYSLCLGPEWTLLSPLPFFCTCELSQLQAVSEASRVNRSNGQFLFVSNVATHTIMFILHVH